MAKQRVLTLKTGDAIKNVQDLKDNIVLLKKNLDTLDIGTEKYQQTLTQLQENQAALRNAMYGTAASMQQVMDAGTAVNVTFDNQNKLVKAETLSYNELVRELAILKQQWRSTTDATERAQLTEKIESVNNRLKDMDKSVGVFGRNVGNYIGAVDHLTAGLSAMGGGAAAVVAPLKGVTMGLKTMSTTPVIAILGVLVGLLSKVTDALKTSEENTIGLTQAMSPLQSIGDAVTKVLQGMGKVIVWLVDQFGKLTTKIFGTNKAMQDRIDLAKQETALAKQERETLVANAKAEREIAELRAKATEKTKYTASERLAFLQKAGDLEKEIADRNRQQAKQEYEAAKLRASLTQSSKEDLDALAAAEAKWIKADTDYYNAVRTINAGIVKAQREETKAAREEAKAREDEAKRARDAAIAKIEAEKEYLSALLDFTKRGSEERLALQNEVATKERDKAKADAQAKITDAEELARTLELIDKQYNAKIEKNQVEHEAVLREQELLAVANRRDALQRGSVEYLTAQVEYQQAALAALVQGADETDAEFTARRLAAEQAVLDAQQALQDRTEAIERTGYENRMNAYEQGSIQYLARALELKQYELDTLHQLEGESEEEFRARQLEAERAYMEAKRAIWEGGVKIMQESVSATSGILGSLADLYEMNSDNDRRNAERVKGLRIAGATIDMLSGVVAAVSNAYKSADPVTASVLAALNSAAIIAAGTVNIAKIKATNISGSGTGSSTASATPSAVVNAPASLSDIPQVRTLTGASEEERFNRMADGRVYILSSDLQADQDARRVQVAETTF